MTDLAIGRNATLKTLGHDWIKPVLEAINVALLKHLGAFMAVLETGRIAGAGRLLRRSPSAISRSLKLLEEEFGCCLLAGSHDGHQVTEQGRLVAARVAIIQNELSRMFHMLKPAGQTAAFRKNVSLTQLGFDVSRLQALIAVNEFGSAQQAGLHLAISQPAISFSIRQLEDCLEKELFARTPKGMVATSAGVTASIFAKRILNELRKMKDDISSADGESSGLVCIGGLAYSRSILLPEAIRMTVENYPKIVVRTVEGPLSSLMAAVHVGEIDAIICARPDSSLLEGLSIKPVADDMMGLFVGANHPLANELRVQASDLLSVPFILPPLGSITRRMLEDVFQDITGSVPKGAVETSSSSVIRKLLLSSNHISFRSTSEFEEEVASKKIVALKLAFSLGNRSICILQRQGSQQTSAVRDFLGLVHQVAAKNVS